ncbi:MAG: hypothetical protein GY847_12325 [Proteobacteria bacterium]|nr:hypothetical protein [Pseudomonadota bacterium]
MRRCSSARGFTRLAAIAAVLVGWMNCAPPPEVAPDAGIPPGGPYPLTVDPPRGSDDVFIDKVIRITFSDHLDSRSFRQSRFNLSSGPLGLWVRFYYDPVRENLVVWPSKSMRGDVTWVLTIDEGIAGLDGKLVIPRELARFRTGKEKGDNNPYDPPSFTYKVAPIFEKHCNFCHGGRAEESLAGLRLDSKEAIGETAIGVESQGWPGFNRVTSSSPGQSYLLFKIIGDKRISGMRMPRSKNMDQPGPLLPRSDQETLADWIASGASFF